MGSRETLSLAIDHARLIGYERQLWDFYQLPDQEKQPKLEEVYRRVKDEPYAKDVIDMYQGVMDGCSALRTRTWKSVDVAAARIKGAVHRILARRTQWNR